MAACCRAIYLLPGIVGDGDGRSARWWGTGKLEMGVSNGTVLLYVGPSALLVERLSHILLVTGLLMCVHGVASFAGRRVPIALVTLLATGALSVLLILVLDPQDVRWPMGCVGLTRGVCLGAIAWMALGIARREGLVTAWIMAALFGIPAVLFAVRAGVQIATESEVSLPFVAGPLPPGWSRWRSSS